MAFIKIEFAQLLTVIIQLVGIIIVLAGKEAQQRRFFGHNDTFQATVGECGIANKIDLANAGRWTFIDLKDQIHAVLWQDFDLWRDGRSKLARAAIDFLHPADIGLHATLSEPRTGFDLDFFFKLILGNRTIAFKKHLVDRGVLSHFDDQSLAALLKLDIGKETCGKQCLERDIDAFSVEWLTWLDRDIGQHSGRLDTLIALNTHCSNNLGRRGGAWGRRLLRKHQPALTHSQRESGGAADQQTFERCHRWVR
jgi:hypothetical protein